MTCLLGFVGFAADVGTLFYAKRNLQIAADSAAIAGAAELNYGDMTTAADSAAAQNGVTVGTNGGAVTINTPPLSGAYVGQAGYIEAIVSQSEPTFFMKMFNITSQTVAARAVATLGSGNGCIYTLGTTGTGLSVTTSSSNPTLNAPKCGIYANSTSGTALKVVASGSPTPIVASSIGVVGGYSEVGGTVSPTPVTGIAPVGDPLAYLPTPSPVGGSCLANPNIVTSGSKTVTVPAGNYCSGISVTSSGGTINFSTGTSIAGSGLSITGSGTTVNFAPGTYTIGGGMRTTGSGINIDGTGVTFYISSGSVSDTASGSTFDLTAPTSGTYNGILFDQSPSDSSSAAITESGTGSTFDGVLYFPDAPLTFTASGTTANLYLAFVVQSLTVTTSGSSINDYAALYGTSPIRAVTLAE
jgi:hypothetical protein